MIVHPIRYSWLREKSSRWQRNGTEPLFTGISPTIDQTLIRTHATAGSGCISYSSVRPFVSGNSNVVSSTIRYAPPANMPIAAARPLPLLR